MNRFVLATNVPYTRYHGGANRSNRALVEALAQRGHRVQVVTPALASPPTQTYDAWRTERSAEGLSLTEDPYGTRFTCNGVDVLAVAEPTPMRAALAEVLAAQPPDWVLVASEDPSQNLLATALDAAPDRVAYLALTPQLFPFGPESLYPGEERAELVRRCRLRLVLSRAAADYVARWGGASAELYTPPHFGDGPFPDLADPHGPALLVNASQVKGLPIFMALADAFPDRRFATLPGYATSAEDRAALAAKPNVELRENRPSLNDVYDGTSVVLMPSLWFESFGLVAVDAMLRGIPVLGANHGALPEALLGTWAPLPVRPIEGYRDRLGDNLLLEPIVPVQDPAPWRAGLAELWSDDQAYRQAADRARAAAAAFVADLSVEPFERLLQAAEGARSTRPAPRAQPSDGAPDRPLGRSLSPAQKANVLRRLQKRKAEAGAPARDAIPQISRDGDLPLSPGQRRLYFLQRLDPESPVYNTSTALRLRGALDEAALRAALDALLARHEALRTVVVEVEGQPRLRVAPAAAFPLEILDLANAAEAETVLAACAARPFDLTQAPLVRGQLLRLAPGDAILLLVVHHAATDAWSGGVLLRDLAALYAAAATGADAELPAPTLGFADYAAWQAGEEVAGASRAQEDYWVARLRDAPHAIQLPSDRPRPAVRRQLGDSLPIKLPDTLAATLSARAKDAGATPFMLLLAAWAALLHRVGGDEDMVFGIPVANRGRAETEAVVGFFVNTLPLRLDLAGNPSFDALLAQVRDRLIEGFQNQEAAFERVVERLDLPRSRSHTPLFQTLFGLHSAPTDVPSLPGLEVTPLTVHNGTAKFDLNVELTETPDGLDGSIEFDTELFERDTVERLFGAWLALLRGICERPQDRLGGYPLLSADEAAALARRLGPAPSLLTPGDSLAARLRAAAAATPEAPALRLGEATMSYRELDARSDALAAALVAQGVEIETPVAFALERGFERTLALIAILKAGGACLPLDLALPDERLRLIAHEAGAPFVLVHGATAERARSFGVPICTLDAVLDGPSGALPQAIRDDAVAYLLYTSGSTGVPKGVAYPHGAELNLMLWFLERLPAPARSLQFASSGFDASFNESLSTLMGGGCLHLLTEGERAEVDRVLNVYLEQEIERAIVPVVLLHLLAERILARPPDRLALRELLVTGEQLKLTPAVTEVMRRYPALRIFNDYGPTESNVVTTLEVTGRSDHYGALPPIGRAIAGSACYVLDRYLQPLPAGMPGELYLAGTCLARGYAGQPAMTAERFLPDPWGREAGARMYRSGDIARLRRDGELELLGRTDDQLKIRGFRVEPAEVEIALRRHPQVGDCLVMARDFPGEDRRLVAYLVPGEEPVPEPDVLKAHLAKRLPDYMIPAHFVTLPAFPLDANGKIDRQQLPMPSAGALSEDRLGPRTELEAAVLAIWAEVLDNTEIDVRDNFFALGGHSLLIIRIISRLREELGVQLPLAEFMDAPTVEQLALAVTAQLADATDLESLLDAIEADDDQPDALAPLQTAGPPRLDAEALRQALAAQAVTAEGPADIAALCVPSSNRPEALDACLRSYLENARGCGRRPEVVVCGTQGDALGDAAYRRVLSDVGEAFGVDVSYAGGTEKLRFADDLAEASGVDPAVVHFALSDSLGVGLPYGVNRNALLLHNAGRAFLSVDDDTRAQLHRLNPATDAVALVGEPGVSEVRVLASRDDALAEVKAEPADWIGAHAAVLGAEAAFLLGSATAPELETRRAPADAFERLADGAGRVALSYQGWVGDAGWASTEDARWLTGASLDWITRDAGRYATALSSREVVRAVRGLTLSRGGDFFCLSAGFDARQPLAPFLPVQRREDALFGWLANLADAAALAAHLPGLILHDRAPTAGTTTARADAIDLAGLVQAALSEPGPLPPGPGARLEALGAFLRTACERPPATFDAWLRDRVEAQQAREFAEVEARVAAWPAERAFWSRDAEVALELARRRAAEPDAHLPRRLGGGQERLQRLAQVQNLLQLFGSLVEAWPTLMRNAARLRAADKTLARPLELAAVPP